MSISGVIITPLLIVILSICFSLLLPWFLLTLEFELLLGFISDLIFDWPDWDFEGFSSLLLEFFSSLV